MSFFSSHGPSFTCPLKLPKPDFGGESESKPSRLRSLVARLARIREKFHHDSGKYTREVELENGSILRIEPRPLNKTRRPQFKASFERSEQGMGSEEYTANFFYRGQKIGFAEIPIVMKEGKLTGILDYLEIGERFRGNGFSIDALHEINSFLRVSRLSGFLENKVLSPGMSEEIRGEISKIYERMGWQRIDGTDYMELPLK